VKDAEKYWPATRCGATSPRRDAIQADLIRWDDSRARFVLTGTGRSRITARSRSSGKILRFKMRDEKDGRAPLRKA
jgi:hypothetical protein